MGRHHGKHDQSPDRVESDPILDLEKNFYSESSDKTVSFEKVLVSEDTSSCKNSDTTE